MGVEVACVHYSTSALMETAKEYLDREFKTAVLHSLIEKLEESLRSLAGSIQRDFDSEGDSFDTANKIAHLYDSSAVTERVLKLKREIDCLREIDIERRNTVSAGSLIVVDFAGEKERFLILPAECFSGFETVEVGGVKVSTLTTKAPLFSVLAGKKAGEKVRFNKREITLLEVV
jgi:transcription elongation GreA/GreB family factor